MPKIDSYYNIEGHTEIDPDRVGGSPVLNGHRLTIAQLLAEVIDEGLPAVARDRDFTLEDIGKAALALNGIAKHLENPHKLLSLWYETRTK